MSGFLAVRFHDVVQVARRDKTMHGEAAALFMLGYLLHMHAAIPNHISKSQWAKIAWGTAFICLHHSDPEKIPEPAELVQQGYFDPQTLLQRVQETAQQAGYQSLAEFFPPFAMIDPFLEALRQNDFSEVTIGDYTSQDLAEIFQPPPEKGNGYPQTRYLEAQEAEGLIKQAKVVAAADKLDSVFPPQLAAVRMALTKQKRIFYEPISTETLSVEDELEQRIADGADIAHCDLNRVLYEITRTEVAPAVSPYLSYAYPWALRQIALFYQRAIPAFLQGNVTLYLEGYREEEKQMVIAMVRRASIDPTLIENLSLDERLQQAQQLIQSHQQRLLDTLQQAGLPVRVLQELMELSTPELVAIKFLLLNSVGKRHELAHHYGIPPPLQQRTTNLDYYRVTKQQRARLQDILKEAGIDDATREQIRRESPATVVITVAMVLREYRASLAITTPVLEIRRDADEVQSLLERKHAALGNLSTAEETRITELLQAAVEQQRRNLLIIFPGRIDDEPPYDTYYPMN